VAQKAGKAVDRARHSKSKSGQRKFGSGRDDSEQKNPESSKPITTEVENVFEIDGLLQVARLISEIRKEGRLGN
jgi:hypothetical protein